jgi:hypothetical protein
MATAPRTTDGNRSMNDRRDSSGTGVRSKTGRRRQLPNRSEDSSKRDRRQLKNGPTRKSNCNDSSKTDRQKLQTDQRQLHERPETDTRTTDSNSSGTGGGRSRTDRRRHLQHQPTSTAPIRTDEDLSKPAAETAARVTIPQFCGLMP